jgi:hypothetical protein
MHETAIGATAACRITGTTGDEIGTVVLSSRFQQKKLLAKEAEGESGERAKSTYGHRMNHEVEIGHPLRLPGSARSLIQPPRKTINWCLGFFGASTDPRDIESRVAFNRSGFFTDNRSPLKAACV